MLNRKNILKYCLLIVNIVLIILLLDTFGIHGVWMYLLFVLLITLPKLWMQRKQITDFMKYVETVFFGKPLDQDQWKPNEFKNRNKDWGELYDNDRKDKR